MAQLPSQLYADTQTYAFQPKQHQNKGFVSITGNADVVFFWNYIRKKAALVWQKLSSSNQICNLVFIHHLILLIIVIVQWELPSPVKSLVHTVRYDSRVIMYFSSMKNAKNNAKKEKKEGTHFFLYKIVDDKNKQTPLLLTQLWFAVEVQARVIEWTK